MAIVNFVKCLRTQTVGGLNGVLNYCCQKAKTDYEGRPLVSGVNCVQQLALQEFMNTKRLHRSTSGRMYYHMIQSFHPDENLTPETAHAIALKLAAQIPGFEIVVATHTDRDHIHSHFVINSVSFDTGKKYHSNMDSLNALRQASDKLCLEYGLSVVKSKQQEKERAMPNREYRAYEKGNSWKMGLEICIDECMTLARDRSHFFKLMEYNGYGVKWTKDRKYITYTTPDGHKCRDIKLNGCKYHKEVMEYEFTLRKEISCRYAAGAEGYDLHGGSSAADGSCDGTQLESDDRIPESAGQNAGRDSDTPGSADHYGSTHGLHGATAGDPEEVRRRLYTDHGAIPGGDDDLSGERGAELSAGNNFSGETGWECEREIWESHLAGAGKNEEYFEEAVLDLHDPLPDLGHLGTDAAYLAAGLTNIIDDRPVEDSTTKHYRPERKNTRGPVMGGM